MSDFSSLPKHYSNAEAAQYLGVSPRTVKRLRRSGKLGSIRVGRRPRITEAQLRAYIEEQSGGSCLSDDGSADSSSRPAARGASTTSAGTTRPADRRQALALAQQISRSPSSRSPSVQCAASYDVDAFFVDIDGANLYTVLIPLINHPYKSTYSDGYRAVLETP